MEQADFSSNDKPTQDTENKTSNQPDQSQAQMIPTSREPEPEPSETHYEITCKTEKNWWDKAKPFVEILGVGLLALYTGFTIATFWQIKKQTPEIAKSADAAKTASETTKNSFDMEKRRAEDTEEAVCTVQGEPWPSVGDRFFHTYIPCGKGQVPARGLIVHVELSLNTLPSNKRLHLIDAFDLSEEKHGAKLTERYTELGFIHGEWNEITNAKNAIVEEGTIQYDNGFGRIIHGSICMVFFAYSAPDGPHGQGVDCGQLQITLDSLRRQGKIK